MGTLPPGGSPPPQDGKVSNLENILIDFAVTFRSLFYCTTPTPPFHPFSQGGMNIKNNQMSLPPFCSSSDRIPVYENLSPSSTPTVPLPCPLLTK